MGIGRSRSEEDKAQRRVQILDAAIVEFDCCGYEGATMSGVARRAGLSRTLVNFYFGSKRRLQSALEEAALEQLFEMLDGAQRRKVQGVDKLRAIMRAYVRFQKRHPGYFSALAREDDPDVTQSLRAPTRGAIQVLAEAIDCGVRDGSVHHCFKNNTQAALVFWASTHGCILIAQSKSEMLKGHLKTSSKELLGSLDDLVDSLFT